MDLERDCVCVCEREREREREIWREGHGWVRGVVSKLTYISTL